MGGVTLLQADGDENPRSAKTRRVASLLTSNSATAATTAAGSSSFAGVPDQTWPVNQYGSGTDLLSSDEQAEVTEPTVSKNQKTKSGKKVSPADEARAWLSVSLKTTAEKNTNNKNHTNDNDPTDHNDNLWEDSEDGNTPAGVASILSATVNSTNQKRLTKREENENKKWTEKYVRLVAYKKQYKTTCVPITCEDDPGLANWVMNQRQFYRKNKLAIDRINRLNSIGFVWKVSSLPPTLSPLVAASVLKPFDNTLSPSSKAARRRELRRLSQQKRRANKRSAPTEERPNKETMTKRNIIQNPSPRPIAKRMKAAPGALAIRVHVNDKENPVSTVVSKSNHSSNGLAHQSAPVPQPDLPTTKTNMAAIAPRPSPLRNFWTDDKLNKLLNAIFNSATSTIQKSWESITEVDSREYDWPTIAKLFNASVENVEAKSSKQLQRKFRIQSRSCDNETVVATFRNVASFNTVDDVGQSRLDKIINLANTHPVEFGHLLALMGTDGHIDFNNHLHFVLMGTSVPLLSQAIKDCNVLAQAFHNGDSTKYDHSNTSFSIVISYTDSDDVTGIFKNEPRKGVNGDGSRSATVSIGNYDLNQVNQVDFIYQQSKIIFDIHKTHMCGKMTSVDDSSFEAFIDTSRLHKLIKDGIKSRIMELKNKFQTQNLTIHRLGTNVRVIFRGLGEMALFKRVRRTLSSMNLYIHIHFYI